MISGLSADGEKDSNRKGAGYHEQKNRAKTLCDHFGRGSCTAADHNQGKLLFTVYHGQSCALSIRNNRLIEAVFFPKIPSRIGSVYIGKVKSLAKNINACFVEIEKENYVSFR